MIQNYIVDDLKMFQGNESVIKIIDKIILIKSTAMINTPRIFLFFCLLLGVVLY